MTHSGNPDILVFTQQAREQIEKLAKGIDISENSVVEMTLFLLESAEEEALNNEVEKAWQTLMQAKSLLLHHFLGSSKGNYPTLNLKNAAGNIRAAYEERRWRVEPAPRLNQWVAHVVPSFNLPATLTVKREQGQSRAEFKVYRSPDLTSASTISVEFPEDWVDPVETVLRQFNPFHHTDEGFILDAIEYNLKITSPVAETELHFWNPVSSPFAELEIAIWSVVMMMLQFFDARPQADYLEVIRTAIYIRRNARPAEGNDEG
jgi:hypothetical protein